MTVPCYIPSYMRAGRVTAIFVLPKCLRPILVVHSSEKAIYREMYPDVKVIATKQRGIGKTRAFICRYAIKHGNRVAAMIDDDITGWIYKERPEQFGGIRAASHYECDMRWRKQIRHALEFEQNNKGYAVAFSYRFALAYPRKKTGPLNIGLVNECSLMNATAMRTVQYTLSTCEDQEATIAWLLNGTMAGQDPYLGHSDPATARTADAGGCGEFRENNPGYHLRNSRRLWKMFPEVVAEPEETELVRDGAIKIKTRISYAKAARIGGVKT